MQPATVRRPVPALVIVDSRNVWGSFKSAFGIGRQVRVPGVAAALAAYGFEAREVHVAIGTRDGGKGAPSRRLQAALTANQQYASNIDNDPMGSVLHGRLVERDGDMAEKLVDVQCAIQIARSAVRIQSGQTDAKAIVVLSEDMDLIPAYAFAQELGVPIYAASHATVDTRPDCQWLLLTEGVLAAACSRQLGRYYGHALRRQILNLAAAIPNAELSFKVVAYDQPGRTLYLSHNSGAQAVCRSPQGIATAKGSQVRLHLTGLEHTTGAGDFPHLTVSQSAPATGPADLIEGTVLRWATPTRIEVRLDTGTTHSVGCSPGALLPGMRVHILDRAVGQQRARRLVGSPEIRVATPGWADSTVPKLVTVTSSASSAGALVRARLATGDEITLQPPGADRAHAGDTYAAVPADHVALPDGSVHVQALAVSSRLPE